MRLNIGTKIFLAITAACLLVVAASALATRWQFQRDFLAYVTAQEQERIADAVALLAEFYEFNDGWDVLNDNERAWHDLLMRNDMPPPRRAERRRSRGEKPPGPPGPPPGGLFDLPRRATLLDSRGDTIVGRQFRDGDKVTSTPVIVAGEVVGTVRVQTPRHLSKSADREFANAQGESILIISAIALLFAAVAGRLFANKLVKPLQHLGQGAEEIASGEYGTQIEIAGNDELALLATKFNRLSKALDNNRESRKRWVADISHELRTPLAVLRGELEALEDGVRSIDEQTIASLQHEVNRITALVEDLHVLSVSDAGGLNYRRERVDLIALLNKVFTQMSPRIEGAGITFTTHIPASTFAIIADATRLEQLLHNVIENSLRYTNAPGQLAVRCEHDDRSATIFVDDSAPGVAREHHTLLFERLYRVDNSRSRDTGGSGLGLSICKAIVDAHDGEISADHSPLGGLRIIVELPAADRIETLQ